MIVKFFGALASNFSPLVVLFVTLLLKFYQNVQHWNFLVAIMYTSIVEPHFRNCCSVRGCCGEILLDKLQKLQNRSAQVVTNSSYDASSLP